MARTNRLTSPSNNNLFRLQTLISNLQRFNHTLASDVDHQRDSHSQSQNNLTGTCDRDAYPDKSLWRVVNSNHFGISSSSISKSSWTAVHILRKKGFKAYLVGGCVRDLLLNKIPKDFDVITTAELKEIKQSFRQARIVGRRFPICHVFLQGSMVEVSSFHKVGESADNEEPTLVSQGTQDFSGADFVRWKNCLARDFTINSLFYDPSINKIYDYTNGMRDLKLGKVQTVIPAHLSFREDSARIFRGIRIAARLGLSFSEETASAIHDLYLTLLNLDKQRVVLEMDNMFSYGAACSSLSLLTRFKILDILLPFHAAHLSAQRNNQTAPGSSMLFKLFSSMDKLVASDRPCTPSVWIGLLAFHMALVKNPQDALIIWAFSSALYYGNWEEAVKFSREKSVAHVRFSPEILETSPNQSDETLAVGVNRFASQVIASVDILTESQHLMQSMENYPHFPSSGSVFISKYKGRAAAKLFDVLLDDTKAYQKNRKSFEIDYRLLKQGNLNENRFLLGKIIMDTMSSAADLDQQLDVHHLPLSDLGKQHKVPKKENNYSGSVHCESQQRVLNEKDERNTQTKKNQLGEEKQSHNFNMHIRPSSHLDQRSEALEKQKTMEKKDRSHKSVFSKMARHENVQSFSIKANANDLSPCMKRSPENNLLISSCSVQQLNIIENDDGHGHQSSSTKRNQQDDRIHQSESNEKQGQRTVQEHHKLSSLFM